MGLENRDYFRGAGGYTDRLGGWGNLDAVPPMVKRLVAANVIVFLLQIFFTRAATIDDYRALLDPYSEPVVVASDDAAKDESPNKEDADKEVISDDDAVKFNVLEEAFDPQLLPRVSLVQKWLELDTRKVVYQGQIWRLLTCAFCHDREAIWHILFNMLLLWWFGQTLELMYGSREFLLFYLTAALVASLAFVGLDVVTGSTVPMIGASGAVMAVMMVYVGYYPRATIRIWFIFPIEIRWLLLFYVIYDVHPVLLALAGDRALDGIAHAAHLGGLAFGFLYWRQQWRLEPLLERLPNWQFRMKAWQSGLKVVRPPPPRNRADTEVDEILAKIGEQGLDSLTPRERQTLERASQRYKQREP